MNSLLYARLKFRQIFCDGGCDCVDDGVDTCNMPILVNMDRLLGFVFDVTNEIR
jgi:hypothetical protein